ncbi:SufBD protein [Caldicellulosiruptor saccharolyticus DSM 8903]|uniref:SufBD protein n=1 Tax=Caldicellulosiruptor saccharolyticus (strain ATCC 43494 / DSM 8903 / Tp8T 6331) TaxID=351627 RepID=A4XGX9_CALS8|nr:SufD family Fe-S cluster assembly protein [Caldicellulosiruptor saccharolyticus]ABP66164.1 SufBD protein [Caldicellulosiruptor saccharolyticus DSM 8903]
MPARHYIDENILALAKSAENKKAAFGTDIDLSRFEEADEKEEIDELSKLPEEIQKTILNAGIEVKEEGRVGSFLQVDHSVVYKRLAQRYSGQLEILDINEALEKYPEVREKYFWKAVKPDRDKYTAFSAMHPAHGYFIRVFKGQKVEKPVQACLLLQENARIQNVHNIVIVEEGAEVQIINGCTTAPKVKEGLHIGISEFYLEKGSKLTFTMIHNWAEDFYVRPRGVTIVEDDAVFISNYVLLKPVKSIQSFPIAILKGKNSVASFNSILYGLKDSEIDIGSHIILEGENSSGQAISRAIVKDRAKIYSRGVLEAKHNQSRAHLDCRGILFSEEGVMYAVPELLSDGAPQSHLSHEAAIGPIAEEEVEYLMARGLSKDDAISLITQGFMDVKILGLPKHLENYIQELILQTQMENM